MPTEPGWTMLVLIPKLNADTQGIGLLEIVWKVMEAVIDIQIKSVVQLHDFLYRFHAGRGVGTAIVELKLAQELKSVYQDPLFLVLLDLIKVYDNIYQGRLLQTLDGYGAGPKLQELLAGFCLIQEVVNCHNGLHGPQFQTTRGKTKAGIASPVLFNVSVDSVVRHWISIKVGNKSATQEVLRVALGC